MKPTSAKKGKREKTDVELGIQIPEVESATETSAFNAFYEAEAAIVETFINSTQKLYQQTIENFFSEQKMKASLVHFLWIFTFFSVDWSLSIQVIGSYWEQKFENECFVRRFWST